MSVLRTLGWVALAASLAAGHAGAQEGTPPAPPANPTTTKETVVHGTPPAGLPGRWLAVSWLDNSTSTIMSFWQIAEQDGKPVVTERFGLLPDRPRASYDAANEQGQRWIPSADDLAALRDAWNTMPADDVNYAKVWTEIASPDGYDESLKKEARTSEALWVVRQRWDASPAAAPLSRQVFVYAVNGPEDDGYKGTLDGVTVAAVPAGIPIRFSGAFRLYRLDPAPPPQPRGLIARLLDAFRGCRR